MAKQPKPSEEDARRALNEEAIALKKAAKEAAARQRQRIMDEAKRRMEEQGE